MDYVFLTPHSFCTSEAQMAIPDKHNFNGFSQKTIDFLITNSQKNSKQWFEEHRREYEQHVLFPFRELSDSVAPTIVQIDSEIEVRSQRTVSRIYRDTRFSNDKSLYKKALWITFKRPITNWPDFPGFFFELSQESYRFGMGFFAASKDTMDAIRLLIDKKPKLLMTHLADALSLKGFVIEGDEYKKVLNPEIPAEYLSLYQKKNIYFVKNCAIDKVLFSSALATEMSDSFSKLGSLYHFLVDLKQNNSK
jgi:uncharacterized protein (TIGR02453 family)